MRMFLPTQTCLLQTTSPAFDEYPIEDAEQRKNTSDNLYYEDHNGNDTHREHHYRHVTVNHYYYNATNATDDDAMGKDEKHHYYYNEYEHDHRNKTVGDPNTKHHYYYNENRHDHGNKTLENPNTKHHYYYNEYRHDHRNKTLEDPNTKHYHYNEYHRNKTGRDAVTKHYNDHRNKTTDPEEDDQKKTEEGNHYYHNNYRGPSAPPKKKHSSKEENMSEYDEDTSEDEPREGQLDAHGIEDYEYVSSPRPIVKHHHHFKEYHYKNGRLVNSSEAEPLEAQTPKGGFVIVKEPSYDPRLGYVGGSAYPLFGYLNRKIPNGSVGYYLVDPLGRLPTLRIHASLLTTERRVQRFNPGALHYHPAAIPQPLRRQVALSPRRYVDI